MRNSTKARLILTCLFTLIFLQAATRELFAADSEISVFASNELGAVNQKLFGNNIIGVNDPMSAELREKNYFGFSNFGAGIWDSRTQKGAKEVIGLAKAAHITLLRFPGGSGADVYDWKSVIGKTRKDYLFGIDEFLQTCSEIGAEPVYTINVMSKDENDAADLIQYLYGSTAYASVYNKVSFFEIGNEPYLPRHKISPEIYGLKFLKYYARIKGKAPHAKIGVVLHTNAWNNAVCAIIKDRVDFGIMHIYPTPLWGEGLSNMAPADIFKVSWALPIIETERHLQNTLKILKEYSGNNIPLAITEYNGGFVQNKPVPYRHCLGNALLNAELLRIFMKPEHNILMANYWNFVNEYWGMIANGFDGTYKTLYNPYYKRPNYYVFEMYHKHFGNILIGTEINSNNYEYKGKKIPYLSVNASKSKDGDKVYLMVINKNMDESITSTIDLKDFLPAQEGNAWVLNGPSVDATNEQNHDNVKVTHKSFKITSNPFEFTFEPHSLTAIEVTRKEPNEK